MTPESLPHAADEPNTLLTLPDLVGRVAAVVTRHHYPGGDRAALKRWSPDQPLPLAYYRLWLQHLRLDPPADVQATNWMGIVWGLALAGEGAHQSGLGIGRALAESRYAEARLERLLSAPDSTLRMDFYQSAVRFLASKGSGCNWVDWASYLLTAEPDRRETLNRKIARDYYRHLPRQAD